MKITYSEAVCLTCVRHRVSVVIYFISRASLTKKPLISSRSIQSATCHVGDNSSDPRDGDRESQRETERQRRRQRETERD